MPRHTLVQTWNNSTTPQSFNLGAGDDVDTGTMSDCVSVIVLFNHNGAHYTSIVGQHGGGGIANVNMVSLLNLIPVAARATARVIIISGHNALTEQYTSINNTAIRQAKGHLLTAGFRDIRISWGWSGAFVNAKGDCKKY